MPGKLANGNPANKGGRPKGSVNKFTRELKDMILGALDDAGGQKYLREQAIANPTAFMTLVGKVLPLQVAGEGGGPLKVEFVTIYEDKP